MSSIDRWGLPPRLSAATGVAGLLTALVAGCAAALTWSLAAVRAPGPASLDDGAALLAAAAVLALVTWWAGGALLVAAGTLARAAGYRWSAGERLAERVLPRWLHALLVTAVGAGVLAAPAVAAVPAASASTLVVQSAAPTPTLDPAWSPTQPDATTEPVAPAAPPQRPAAREPTGAPLLVRPVRPASAPETEVVVHRGDTLWEIAARRLPVDSTDAQIAAEWPRWYQANRDVIGADPGLLWPGQRLRPPGVCP